MTKVKIEPDKILANFLRGSLTDINSSRSGTYIFPDFPRVKSLGNTEFPRIGITIISEDGKFLGMHDDDTRHKVVLQIDVIAKKDQIYSVTTTSEALGTMSSTANSSRMTFNQIPTTITNIKHTSTSYGTTTAVEEDANFTTPASLAAGTVQWSKATGNLNFSSADVSSHNGEAITSTYVVKMEGKKVCQYLARTIVKLIKNNHRTADTLKGMFDPVLMSNVPMPLEEDLGIYRQVVEYEFTMYNIGEDIQ